MWENGNQYLMFTDKTTGIDVDGPRKQIAGIYVKIHSNSIVV